MLTTTQSTFEGWLSRQPLVRVVLEASAHSRWVASLLDRLGYEVIVANPRQVALVYAATRKNDRNDAERLARLGRMDPELLCPVHRRSDAAQQELLTVKARQGLVRARTRLVNAVRAMVKSFGLRVPACSSPRFVAVAREAIPEEMVASLEPMLLALNALNEQIKVCDVRIRDAVS